MHPYTGDIMLPFRICQAESLSQLNALKDFDNEHRAGSSEAAQAAESCHRLGDGGQDSLPGLYPNWLV